MGEAGGGAWRVLPEAGTVLAATSFAVQAATPLVLETIGFTSVGPAAGSTAAAWMASMGSAGVTSGSWYAACQSAAMGGAALFSAPALIGIGAIPAVGYVGFRLAARARQAKSPTLRSVQVAHELINAGHHCLDVRTQEEYSAGHVEGSVNIPYLVKDGTGMSKNLKFLEQVEAMFSKDDEIVVVCQDGSRSMKAAAELLAASFTGVIAMEGGYLAWTESGLPVKSPGA